MRCLLACDNQRAGAVIDTGGIARSHAPAIAERRRQLGQLIQRRRRPGMLIPGYDERISFRPGN